MTRPRRTAALACLVACSVALGGCTSTADTLQAVAVSTVPDGASCTVERGGASLGTVSPTPGTLVLERGAGDIAVVCTKHGYKPARVTKSAMTTRTANALGTLGDPIVTARGYVDLSSGSAYSYPPRITVPLDPTPAGAKPRR